MTSARFSSVTACPRMPIAGTVSLPKSAFESTEPDGTSWLNARTSIEPYFLTSLAFSALISFSLTVR
jgi:hypothetical protein